MDYSQWKDQIEKDCPQAINVRGGSLCRVDEHKRGYCGFGWCPRRPDLVKNGI
jgi:hypothetical protein